MEIHIVGVPMDLGADRRGVDMGPSAIRYAGLHEKLRRLGHTVVDLGNIEVPVAESLRIRNPRIKYAPEVARVSRNLARTVEKICLAGAFPLVLGGDHSIAIGTLAGVARCRPRCGVLWIDAHGDFNTPETTLTGNIHGMPLAVSVGIGARELLRSRGEGTPTIRPEKVVIIGARSLDEEEREVIKRHGVHVYTMHEIDRMGIAAVMEEALAIVSEDTDGVHVSFDIDVVDPLEAPGVGTPARGGLTYREAHLAMEMIYEARVMTSLEMVEVNPILDTANATGQLAADLIASALGKRIL